MVDTVIYHCQAHVAHIIINRPENENKINEQLISELKEICSQIKHDNDVRVVVLTGVGKTFCSGSESIGSQFHETIANEIAGIDRPVIAAINGDALGQGLELALACDIRVAADTAHFGLPQIVSGHISSDGGTQRLPRLIGRAKALELILTGDIIGANKALEIDLVHKVVPPDSLTDEVEIMANTMSNKATFALKYAKEAVIKGMDLTMEQGLRLEADMYMLLHTTSDRVEGISAFQQKRTPDFKGK